MEGEYEDRIEAADDLMDQQVHDVEVEETIEYLERQGYDGETGSFALADRVLLVESPSVTDSGIELRFLKDDQDTPYAIVDVDDQDEYGVLLE
ncbi:MAG: hypothetical protein ABEJ91_04260 [Candidatus Nanohaloarchaea archaeon]